MVLSGLAAALSRVRHEKSGWAQMGSRSGAWELGLTSGLCSSTGENFSDRTDRERAWKPELRSKEVWDGLRARPISHWPHWLLLFDIVSWDLSGWLWRGSKPWGALAFSNLFVLTCECQVSERQKYELLRIEKSVGLELKLPGCPKSQMRAVKLRALELSKSEKSRESIIAN